MYTDGLIECRDENDKPYGYRRLHKSVTAHATRSLAELFDGVVADYSRFFGDTPREDDLTLVAARMVPP